MDMKKCPLPIRKSPRATFHDYSGGNYFVTICTHLKKHYFGNIRHEEMILNEIGRCAYMELENIHSHYECVEIPLFVVMPNHIHAIICIDGNDKYSGGTNNNRSILSVVIGNFKRAVTISARKMNKDFRWQSRYHDHIIRDSSDGNKISEYIETNVARWDCDCFNL